jgi:hypothetical protein
MVEWTRHYRTENMGKEIPSSARIAYNTLGKMLPAWTTIKESATNNGWVQAELLWEEGELLFSQGRSYKDFATAASNFRRAVGCAMAAEAAKLEEESTGFIPPDDNKWDEILSDAAV